MYTSEHIVMDMILHLCQQILLNITHCTFKEAKQFILKKQSILEKVFVKEL